MSFSDNLVSLLRGPYYKLQSEWLKNYYAAQLSRSQNYGLTKNKRDRPLIVSLTSIPPRLDHVQFPLSSLLSQSLQPDQLILWLPETIGGGKEKNIPDNLIRLIDRGLTIEYCQDIGPHTKLNYALLNFPDAIIVTADDDKFYPRSWLSDLYTAYLQEPNYIHAHRAHLMTFDHEKQLKSYADWDLNTRKIVGPSQFLFPTGTGGVLYPPKILHDEVLNQEAFFKLCPNNDDIWYKAMALLNRVPAKKSRLKSSEFFTVPETQTSSLWSINIRDNNKLIKSVFEKYGLYEIMRDYL